MITKQNLLQVLAILTRLQGRWFRKRDCYYTETCQHQLFLKKLKHQLIKILMTVIFVRKIKLPSEYLIFYYSIFMSNEIYIH